MSLVLKENSDPLKIIRARYTKTNVFSAEQMRADIEILLGVIDRLEHALNPTPRNLVSLPGQHEMILQGDEDPW